MRRLKLIASLHFATGECRLSQANATGLRFPDIVVDGPCSNRYTYLSRSFPFLRHGMRNHGVEETQGKTLSVFEMPKRGYRQKTIASQDAKDISMLIQSMRQFVREKNAYDALRVFGENGKRLKKVATTDPLLVADAYDFALQAYALEGNANKAERLVSRMWKDGIPVGRVARNSVVMALCAADRRLDALKYLKSVSAQRSDIVGYNILLKACVEERDYLIGIKTWEALRGKIAKSRNEKFRFDARTMTSVLRLHGHRSNATELEGEWDRWVQCQEYKTSSDSDKMAVAASYVAALCDCNAFDGAVAACQSMLKDISGHLPVELVIPGDNSTHDPNKHQLEVRSKGKKHGSVVQNARVACNTVLHATVMKNMDYVMDKVLNMMTSMGLTPDTVTYNALLRRSLRRQEGSVAIQEGLAEMQRTGLKPDKTSLEILIQSLAMEGEIERAERAVDVIIHDYNCDPEHAWASLMTSCGLYGDVSAVGHVFQKAQLSLAKFSQDKNSYVAVIVSSLQALYSSVDKDYWRRILRRGYTLSGDQDQHEIVREEGIALFSEICNKTKELGISETEHVQVCSLQVLGALGQKDKVEHMIEKFGIDLYSSKHDSTKTKWSTYVDILNDVHSTGRNVPKSKQPENIFSNTNHYSMVLQTLGRMGHLKGAFAVVKLIMVSNCITAPTNAFSIIIYLIYAKIQKEII